MRNIVFDFPLQFVKSLFSLRDADIVDIQSEDGKGDTHEQRGFGVLPGADAGGFHYNQFAVGKHAVVNEKDGDKQGYRRQNDIQPRHQKRRHFDKQAERQPFVGNQFDKAQRLGKPKDGQQRKSYQQEADKNLFGDVDV